MAQFSEHLTSALGPLLLEQGLGYSALCILASTMDRGGPWWTLRCRRKGVVGEDP